MKANIMSWLQEMTARLGVLSDEMRDQTDESGQFAMRHVEAKLSQLASSVDSRNTSFIESSSPGIADEPVQKPNQVQDFVAQNLGRFNVRVNLEGSKSTSPVMSPEPQFT